MKRIVTLTALVTLLLAGNAEAQQLPPGKWWRRPEIVQNLAITNVQQDKLDAVFRQHANNLIDQKADVEKASLALRGELDKAQLDRDAIQRAAAAVNASRAKLFSQELMMLVDMRQVLTEEQWNKMRQHLSDEGRRQPRGFGQPPDGGRGPMDRRPPNNGRRPPRF
jgi:Spy/CpxP family protein refolding chaperone